MSQVIWKYPLGPGPGETVLDMPEGARVPCVQVQHDVPSLWAMVDPARRPERRAVVFVGTGHPFGTDVALPYIGTFQLFDGGFGGHVFELPLDLVGTVR